MKSIFKILSKIALSVYKAIGKRRAAIILAFLTGFVVLIVFASTIFTKSTSDNKSINSPFVISDSIPDFRFSKFDGSDSKSYLSEQNSPKTVLFFWEPWCIRCNEVYQNLANSEQAISGQLRVIAINTNLNESSSKFIITSKNLDTKNFYYFYDNDSSLHNTFGVVQNPQIFYISSDKKIIDTDIYFNNWNIIKQKLVSFVTDFKNAADTQIYQGVKSIINPDDMQIACQSTQDTNYANSAKLPNAINPEKDVLLDCVGSDDNPQFSQANDSVIVKDTDNIKVTFNKQSRYYPILFLTQHIIVNDQMDGVPYSVVFDPISYTVNVFKRVVAGNLTRFGFAGREYEHSLILYDQSSYTFWNNGKGIYGQNAGTELDKLPFSIVKSKDIPKNSDTYVLLAPTNSIDYSKNSFKDFWNNDQFIYSLSKNKDKTITTKVSENTFLFKNSYFSTRLGSLNLEFENIGDNFRDENTGSIWDENGNCIDGALRGNTLERNLIEFGMKFNIPE